jgi:capsular exopolysaccharide synthesis family protein
MPEAPLNSNIPQQFNFEDDGINIKKYLFKILVNWYWFVLSIFAGLTIAYFVNRYSEELYSVNASIIVKDMSDASGVESILYEIFGRRMRKSIVENEISILKSYKLAQKTLQELPEFNITYIGLGRIRERRLYKNSKIIVNVDTSHYQTYNYPILLSFIDQNKYRLQIDDNFNIDTILNYGQQFIHPAFSFNVVLRDSDFSGYRKYRFYINNINNLANVYRSKIKIELDNEKGSVLNLSIQGAVAQQEVDYLNKLCEVYLEFGLEEKNLMSTRTINFIDEQLSNIRDSLRQAEIKLQNFRTKNKVLDISTEAVTYSKRLEEYENEKGLLLLKKQYLNYLNDYLKDKVNVTELVAPSAMGIENTALNQLVADLNKLLSERRVISYTASEPNPSLELIDIKIESIRKSLSENINSLYKTNELAISEINKKIFQVEADINKLPENEIKLIGFEREFNIQNNIYTFLLQKKAEAGITKASNIPDSRILDNALLSNVKQIKPKKKTNNMLGGIIGALIPLLIILIIDFFNNRIIERKYIEEHTNIPILGSIGHNSRQSEIPVLENPRSSLAESFRTLRTNLNFMTPIKKPQIINVTSSISGEGKTFCAINLAVILALADKKTLLLSLDLRKPKIHRIFNLSNEIGISTYLIGNNTFNEIITQTAVKNLSVAVSGPVPPNPAELLETQAMKNFISEARNNFDHIIIDTPPVAIVTDALLTEKFSDLTVFVIRQNYSHKDVLEMLNDIYTSHKIQNLGIIVNDINVPGYYGYYYGYQYGYGYRYGYEYRYGKSYGHDYYGDEPEKESFFKKLLSRILN